MSVTREPHTDTKYARYVTWVDEHLDSISMSRKVDWTTANPYINGGCNFLDRICVNSQIWLRQHNTWIDRPNQYPNNQKLWVSSLEYRKRTSGLEFFQTLYSARFAGNYTRRYKWNGCYRPHIGEKSYTAHNQIGYSYWTYTNSSKSEWFTLPDNYAKWWTYSLYYFIYNRLNTFMGEIWIASPPGSGSQLTFTPQFRPKPPILQTFEKERSMIPTHIGKRRWEYMSLTNSSWLHSMASLNIH